MTELRAFWAYVIGAALIGVGVLVGVLVAGSLTPKLPSVPPLSSSVTIVRPSANVLAKIQELRRLESVSFHMERVIDLKQRQDHLFGLIQANDEILLIAAGDVIAGVDLEKMRDGDVTVYPRERRARVRVPPPELLVVSLDNDRTYVHSRKTDLLAQRNEQIESRARQLAESTIRQAALDAGVLERARQSAGNTITVLVRSLDYDRVDISWGTD